MNSVTVDVDKVREMLGMATTKFVGDILNVNDLNPDAKHKRAMRSIILSGKETWVNEVLEGLLNGDTADGI